MVQILCPSSNDFSVARIHEENCRGSIEAMGSKLADEVWRFASTEMDDLVWSSYSQLKVGRLSFICHSVGGLVVRQALQDPMLEPLRCLCYTYISLATPHLGGLFPESHVVSAGTYSSEPT